MKVHCNLPASLCAGAVPGSMFLTFDPNHPGVLTIRHANREVLLVSSQAPKYVLTTAVPGASSKEYVVEGTLEMAVYAAQTLLDPAQDRVEAEVGFKYIQSHQ
jgi:hypothetical protein